MIQYLFDGGTNYLEMRECYMVVDVKIIKADGENLEVGANTAFVDNSLHSLFEQTSVFLNGVKITTWNILHS